MYLGWYILTYPLISCPLQEFLHVLTFPHLLCRKQLFFKDANLDQNDPIQMNLVYTKVKEDVIDGTHPVSKDEAVHLAALQCQVLYGNYNEAKHKPGFLR